MRTIHPECSAAEQHAHLSLRVRCHCCCLLLYVFCESRAGVGLLICAPTPGAAVAKALSEVGLRHEAAYVLSLTEFGARRRAEAQAPTVDHDTQHVGLCAGCKLCQRGARCPQRLQLLEAIVAVRRSSKAPKKRHRVHVCRPTPKAAAPAATASAKATADFRVCAEERETWNGSTVDAAGALARRRGMPALPLPPPMYPSKDGSGVRCGHHRRGQRELRRPAPPRW